MIRLIQSLMGDANFKAFLAHPKVQALFNDPEFKEVAKTRDFTKITTHPKFSTLMRDPEVASLMARVDLKGFAVK